MKDWLPNALCFQGVWIASVGGAANGWWWAGPLAVLMFASWQLPLSRWPRADLLLMLGAAAIGFLVDSLWVRMELMRFSTPLPWSGVAPVWIVALWMGFALTLNHSLAGLKRHPWLGAALGLVGGPMAYGIAERAWSAVNLTEPAWIALLALGLAWAVVTPLLLLLAVRLDSPPRPALG